MVTPLLRQDRRPAAHPRARPHRRRDGTSLLGISRGRRGARPRRALGRGVEEPPRPAAAAGHRATGKGTTGWCSTRSSADHVRVGDPARGLRTLSREEFDEKWTGYAALFAYPSVRGRPGGQAELPLAVPVPPPAPARLARGRGCSRSSAAGLELVVPVFTQVVVDDAIPDERPAAAADRARRPCVAGARRDDRRHVAPALHPQLGRGSHRHAVARLPDRAGCSACR